MTSFPAQPFYPLATVAIPANDVTAQSAAITQGNTALVLNSTTDVVFVRVGGAGTVATSSDTPIPANSRMLMFIGPSVSVISALSNSVNTGTIFVTMGTGTQY